MARKTPAPSQAPLPELPNAEMEVLAFVRRRGSATIREVSEGLERAVGISAAQALLLRLEAKGLLDRKRFKEREPYRFVPTAAAEPTYRNIARRLVSRVFGGDPVDVVACLLDGRDPTDEEIKQLKQLLADAQRRKKG